MFGLESSRQRVLLPQQFWGQSLVDGLLLALRPAASPAALDNLGALDLIVPRPREDVVSLACAVGHHTRHLFKKKKYYAQATSTLTTRPEAKIVSLSQAANQCQCCALFLGHWCHYEGGNLSAGTPQFSQYAKMQKCEILLI